jgi:hypothetical protein
MSHPDAGRSNSTADLPYGPLPVRMEQSGSRQTTSPDLDSILGFSGRSPEQPAQPGSQGADPLIPGSDPSPSAERTVPGGTAQRTGRDSLDEPLGDSTPEPSVELDLAISPSEADDDVHFGVAAKALGVSRKTVERMVKRGSLERGPSGAAATVSKRGLVAIIEQRRRTGGPLARTTGITPGRAGYEELDAAWSQDATAELQELLRPVLEPLLDDFIAARTRAAVLESQMGNIAARAAKERARDELLLTLATGGWRQRRKARRLALRHYVLRDEVEP